MSIDLYNGDVSKNVDLIEQWKDGTLQVGYYYTKRKNNKVIHIDNNRIVFDDNSRIPRTVFDNSDKIEEVIAPVPTYQEYLESESHCAVYSVVNKQLKEKNGKIISANKRLAKENAHLKDLLRRARGYLCDYTTDIGLLAEIEEVIKQ